MISFSPEEDERLLVDSARAFAQQQLRPRLRASEAARALPDEVRGAFHGLGLVGLDLPEALGFGGLTLVARALVEEELAAGDVGASFALDAAGLAGALVAALGTREQQVRLLGPLVSDPVYAGACALAGGEVACVATPAGDGFTLSGEKRQVLGGRRASFVIVLAQLQGGGKDLGSAGLFAVGKEGVQLEEERHPLGLAELPACTLRFDGARAERLGQGDLRPSLRAALLRQAAVAAARAIGAARASFELARRYAEERTAFGKPIGHFQSIAFLLADMATELDGARALLWRGCSALDRGQPDAEVRLAEAIAQARDAAFFITDNGVQILGGAGYVQDHPLEKWMRDVRALAQYALPAEAAIGIALEQQGAELADDDVFCFAGAATVFT